MKQKTWVEISKSVITANIKELKKFIGGNTLFMAVVKGNAYGADIKTVASLIFPYVDWFGVDSLDEANLVRQKCKTPILILGYVSIDDSFEIIKNKYSVVVYTYDLAVALSKNSTKENPAKMHIKVDTGLARLGLWPEETIDFVKKILTLPNIIIEGIYTHYARLFDENNVEIYKKQLKEFYNVIEELRKNNINPKLIHSASSMAAILFKETHFNLVRIGIPMYGYLGRETSLTLLRQNNIPLILRPVITWKTTIINVKKVSANAGIGYGHKEVIAKKSIVAILNAGFYDGIDKRYGKVGHVLIKGKRAKILGGVSMNMCAVDVTDIGDVKIGDIAILIGQSGKEKISAYEFARIVGSSVYEILTRINPILERKIVK